MDAPHLSRIVVYVLDLCTIPMYHLLPLTVKLKRQFVPQLTYLRIERLEALCDTFIISSLIIYSL